MSETMRFLPIFTEFVPIWGVPLDDNYYRLRCVLRLHYDFVEIRPREESVDQKCSTLRGELDRSAPVELGVLSRAVVGLDRFSNVLVSIDFRSRPKTATRKTPNTLGVEESSSPRKGLHFYSGNSSGGRIRKQSTTCTWKTTTLSYYK